MKLNLDKSKLMQFTWDKDEDVEFQLEVDGVALATPEKQIVGVHKGRSLWACGQKHLGFICDSFMMGTLQVRAAVGKAKAKCQTANVIAKRLGEEAALLYVHAVVTPSALYGVEMLEPRAAKPLHGAAFNALMAEATLTGIVNEWWRGRARVRVGALGVETAGLLWEVEAEKRTLGLVARLHKAADPHGTSWVGKMAAKKVDAMCSLWGASGC